MEARPLEPFGAVVHGADPATLAESAASVRELLATHALVVFRGSAFSTEEHIALVGLVGEVLDEGLSGRFHAHIAHDPDRAPAIAAEGVFVGPLAFHSDLTYTREPPQVLSLYAIELPTTGGQTRFANGARALASLPEALAARLVGLHGRHVFNSAVDEYGGRYRESALGGRYFAAEHPLVRPNPRTGRDVLFANELLTDRIVELDPEASEALRAELFAHLYAPGNVLVHHWQPQDLVMWENQEVQHARTDFDRAQRRILRRVITGDAEANHRHQLEFAAQLQGAPGGGAVMV